MHFHYKKTPFSLDILHTLYLYYAQFRWVEPTSALHVKPKPF